MGDFKSIKDPALAVSEESSTRKKRHRVVWTTELHQKFLNAIEQLGGNHKAIPKRILALMNVDGLTRENVASHLHKYRLIHNLKRETNKLNMGQLDGLININATSSALLSINLEKMNLSSFIQQGHHQNSSNSANPSGAYHSTTQSPPRVQNVNQYQPSSSPLKPLLFPMINFSANMGDSKGIKEPAIVCKFPNIPKENKTGPSVYRKLHDSD